MKKQDAFVHVEGTMYKSAGYFPDKPGPSDRGFGRGHGQGARSGCVNGTTMYSSEVVDNARVVRGLLDTKLA